VVVSLIALRLVVSGVAAATLQDVELSGAPHSAVLLGEAAPSADLAQPRRASVRFPHLRPVLMASISAVLFGASATYGVLAGGILLVPLLLAAPLPELFVDVPRGLEISGLDWGAFAAFVAMQSSHSPYVQSLSHEAVAFSLDQGAYASYAVYRDLRVRLEPPEERHGWVPAYAAELVSAPFTPANLLHPIVLIPAGIWIGLQALTQTTSGPLQHQQPAAVAFNFAISAGGALDTAVAEECLFRGFIYEETRHALGKWPARVLNMLLFSLAHLPEYIGTGAGLIITLPELALISLLADIAYDQGGLGESIALHFLFDFTGGFIASLYSTTAPRLASIALKADSNAATLPVLSFAF
jgi:membrane protease YdiL (CAAX protease family)